MRKRPSMLSATFVRNVNVPGRYGDGRGGLGLTLRVKPASRGGCCKSWGQSIRINGRKTTLGLGDISNGPAPWAAGRRRHPAELLPPPDAFRAMRRDSSAAVAVYLPTASNYMAMPHCALSTREQRNETNPSQFWHAYTRGLDRRCHGRPGLAEQGR